MKSTRSRRRRARSCAPREKKTRRGETAENLKYSSRPSHFLGRVRKSMSREDDAAACASTRDAKPPCASVFAGGLSCHIDRFVNASFQVRRV
jgi:hypothetical protein